MKVAVVGSRNLVVGDLSKYLPAETEEIVSGGARGIDSCAAEYAKSLGLKLTEFKPDYDRFGRGAPLKRNITMNCLGIPNMDISLRIQMKNY